MAEQKLNIDVPEDCFKIVKAYLEEANKKGVLSLDDAFLVNIALKNLSKHLVECKILKEHECPEFEICRVKDCGKPECGTSLCDDHVRDPNHMG